MKLTEIELNYILYRDYVSEKIEENSNKKR